MKTNDVVFWRWKKDGKGYSEACIHGVNGNLITFDESFRYSQTWIDVNEIDIAPNTEVRQ